MKQKLNCKLVQIPIEMPTLDENNKTSTMYNYLEVQ